MLSVRQLTAHYGAAQALFGVDLEVGRGETGGQGACLAQGGDGLFDVLSDPAAELCFHVASVSACEAAF